MTSPSSKQKKKVKACGFLDPGMVITGMFVHSTRLPCAVCGSRAGRRLSSPHSGESRDKLFILRFNFWRLGECGAITLMKYELLSLYSPNPFVIFP